MRYLCQKMKDKNFMRNKKANYAIREHCDLASSVARRLLSRLSAECVFAAPAPLAPCRALLALCVTRKLGRRREPAFDVVGHEEHTPDDRRPDLERCGHCASLEHKLERCPETNNPYKESR